VRTEGLTKKYGDKIAVNSVDLTIPRGVAFGYLGPNGAGKTTLIRMLLGLTPSTSGQMWMLGEKVPEHRSLALAKVGAIVEEPRFHEYMTALENLRIAAAVRGPEAEKRIGESLERVGLGERSKDKVKSYSLGMRQRLGIARCLLTDPELLILDEPMNGLDPAGIMEFRLLIRAFVGEGRTVVISSHLLDEIEKTCDAVSIVDQGQIIRQGNLSEMFGNPSGEVEIEVGDSEGALSVLSRLSYVSSVELVGKNQLKFELNPEVKPSQVNSDLVLAGVLVEKFSPTRKTLEDEFLSITSNMGIH
ncbi:unnamed protein product, partial [Acidithrix sp. C25]